MTKKIAVFHSFMDNIGGAEIVGLTLARELRADFYSTNVNYEMIKSMGFEDVSIISIGKVPVNAPYRHQAALARFRMLNLGKKYDFYIIDGDWAVSAAFNNKPSLWYIHSPIREIWDLYEYTRNNIVPGHKRWFFDAWVLFNRHLNKKYVNHVTKFVCNSKNVQKRVDIYLGKRAEIIYPPIETSNFFYKENGNFWLSVNRLITHKRIDLQLQAFAEMPNEKLVIVGSYEQSDHFKAYAEHIKRIKPLNVTILSWVDFEKLQKLYSTCKGFITTSHDEDFGMNVVEAMASGKPVIAPNEGGYKESVVNGKTGILIDDINVSKIKLAIEKIKENPFKYKEECIKHARKFDTEIFIKKIKEKIYEKPHRILHES